MIAQLYIDLDENVIHSELLYKSKDWSDSPHHFRFCLDDGETYGTYLRKGAQDIVKYSQSVLGHDRVNILTSATFDYAKEIVKGAGFNIPEHQIYARHHWTNSYHPDWATWKFRHEHNVLIDNLPWCDNYGKTKFLGIQNTKETQYLQSLEYYGVDHEDYDFFETCKNFIDKLNQ